MATNTAIKRSDERASARQEQNALQRFGRAVVEQWQEFTGFLADVRAEMRKVVAPTWNEVKTTTAVVIVAVFIFGAYFFIVDGIFNKAIHELLKSTGGLQ